MNNTVKLASAIREALKRELGASGRQVSVRYDSYVGGSSIHVTIKVAGISYKQVENLAKPFEKVRRNCYVGVDLDWSLVRPVYAYVRARVTKAIKAGAPELRLAGLTIGGLSGGGPVRGDVFLLSAGGELLAQGWEEEVAGCAARQIVQGLTEPAATAVELDRALDGGHKVERVVTALKFPGTGP